MTLAALTRWDYPLYDAGGDRILGRDVAASVENQPLGLLFQVAGPAAELMLALESDAEQVTYEVSAAGQSPIDRQAYFGFASPVLPGSALGQLLGRELQAVSLGFVASHQPETKLLFGVKLQFAGCTVLFTNLGDEGGYLFEGTPEYGQHLAWYQRRYGPPTWVPQPQLVAPAA